MARSQPPGFGALAGGEVSKRWGGLSAVACTHCTTYKYSPTFVAITTMATRMEIPEMMPGDFRGRADAYRLWLNCSYSFNEQLWHDEICFT